MYFHIDFFIKKSSRPPVTPFAASAMRRQKPPSPSKVTIQKKWILHSYTTDFILLESAEVPNTRWQSSRSMAWPSRPARKPTALSSA